MKLGADIVGVEHTLELILVQLVAISECYVACSHCWCCCETGKEKRMELVGEVKGHKDGVCPSCDSINDQSCRTATTLLSVFVCCYG